MADSASDNARPDDSHWDHDHQNSRPPPRTGPEGTTNGSLNHENGPEPETDNYQRGSSVGEHTGSAKGESGLRDKLKTNKVYIGGLPEHTRQEDLHNCFGKIGVITNIELKVGYGFVEFDSDEAALESVAKYNEGYFMGNKIRVEISHGGNRSGGNSREPGACFRCGQQGHWARECPNHQARPSVNSDAPLIDRIDRGPSDRILERPVERSRDYPPPPPRDRYEYPPAVPARDYPRPRSPVRDYRDYPAPPPPGRPYDDYRRRSPDRYAQPPPDYRGRYDYRYPPQPAPYPQYDRFDGRAPGPGPDRYAPYPGTAAPMKNGPGGRPRSPPRYRDDYDRARDYGDYRGPPPPARYQDYPPPPNRRRSLSPPHRYDYPPPHQNNGYADTYNPRAPPPPLGSVPRNNTGRDFSAPPPSNGYRHGP